MSFLVTILKRLPIILAALLMGAIALSLVTIQCGSITDNVYVHTPTPTPTPIPTPIPSSTGPVYGNNFCGNSDPAGSPFRGWPTSDTSKHGDGWITPGGRFCDSGYSYGTHEGIDLLYYLGTPVIATGEALVIEAGWNDVMGNYVRLCSGIVSGWCIRYMHLSSVTVGTWQTATAGQIIGYAGGTGTGAGGDLSGSNGRVHLHYDMAFNDQFFDPYLTLHR